MTVVKVCDVRDENIARICVEAGVSMIGLHCVWNPMRVGKRNLLLSIKRAFGACLACVLVTREPSEDAVLEMAGTLPWDYIQLHAPWEEEGILRLRKGLRSQGSGADLIGVVEATAEGVKRMPRLVRSVDLLLIDSSIHGGTGKVAGDELMEEATSLAKGRKLFIAGGLRSENVCKTIRRYRPHGVDVQSGVEQPSGRVKDPQLILSFVQAVRDCDAGK